MRRFVPTFAFAALLAIASSFAAVPARATIVERVVAVVGERPILLTDLRSRARPYLLQILASSRNQAQQAAQESEMYRELLNRMIDERLEQQAADKSPQPVSVTSDELDRTLKQKAASLGIDVKDLYAEARRQGMTDNDYREEMRRQALEFKLINLRVANRVRVTEEDARNEYAQWIRESQKAGQDNKVVEPRILARQLSPNLTSDQLATEKKLADSIVAKARSGTDFCSLVLQYSQDVQTRSNCGSRGVQPMAQLLPPLDTMVASLKAGQISDPVELPGQAIIILQLVSEPRIATYEDVKPMMQERATQKVIDQQRKQWLQELRRGVYIDVRL